MLKTPLKFLITIVLTLGLSMSFQSLLASWTAPTASPPNNNVTEPINAGSVPQSKNGLLSLLDGLNVASTTILNGNLLVASGHNVGIGTLNPQYTLDVVGEIRSSNGGFIFPDNTVQTSAAKGPTIHDAAPANPSPGDYYISSKGLLFVYINSILGWYEVADVNFRPDYISPGVHYTCTIINNAAKCWGENAWGQLGDGTANNSLTPVQVNGLTTGVSSIASQYEYRHWAHTCAVHNGAAKCWGNNISGQLGDGTTNNSLTPVQVSGLTSGVTSVYVTMLGSCAIHNGAAKCWGRRSLGDGTMDDSSTPVQVSGLTSGVTSISFPCAIHNGAAKCWGTNHYGELGNGTTNSPTFYQTTPVQVSGLDSGVTSISTGINYSCAIHNGAAKCWGKNWYGQLGDGTNTDRSTPVQVRGLTSGVTSISTGSDYSCAIHYGVAKCWGGNYYGQLGDGTTNHRYTPVLVSGLDSSVSIYASSFHTCAIHNGVGKCWGRNNFGQLGDRTTINRPTPVNIIKGPIQTSELP